MTRQAAFVFLTSSKVSLMGSPLTSKKDISWARGMLEAMGSVVKTVPHRATPDPAVRRRSQ